MINKPHAHPHQVVDVAIPVAVELPWVCIHDARSCQELEPRRKQERAADVRVAVSHHLLLRKALQPAALILQDLDASGNRGGQAWGLIWQPGH